MAKRGMIPGRNKALAKAALERHALLRKLREEDRQDLAILDEALDAGAG